MESKWEKIKLALGLKLCVYVPRTSDDSDSPPNTNTNTIDLISNERLSNVALLSPPPSSHALFRLSKSGSKSSSKQTCSICLTKMMQGGGHAIFTAECTHSFHFHCISSNVKHGNQICPVCRAKWTEIPLQGSTMDPPPNDTLMAVVRRLPPVRRDLSRRHVVPLFQTPEPGVYDDDESLDHQPVIPDENFFDVNDSWFKTMEIRTYPEVSVVSRSDSHDNFTVLVHLKAPSTNRRQNLTVLPQLCQMPRASVDLVTVLDISGSMAGTKLALLKRAIGFIIQNLSSNDRLSVIAFSSMARRLFPLRRMSDTGKQQALQAVNSLVANGGTNITDGLRKGAKIMEDRREKNPVASIILLSDGQDTYNTVDNSQTEPNYHKLLLGDNLGFEIPVHAFGFGADHNALSMHSISEISGGTFSFIETEAAMQDAFAQCIGGLLSVLVQELRVEVECIHPSLRLNSLKVGSYSSRVVNDGRKGFIDVGDLYADEERDFLVSVNVPTEHSGNPTSLIKVRCVYKNPLTKDITTLKSEELRIDRPEIVTQVVGSIEVDRQRNRFQATDDMARARTAAENGDLAAAVSILDNSRRILSKTISAQSGDKLWVGLDAELKEMQERMVSRHVYEASGRAYILSGMSSHSWQRATARGDSTDGPSLIQAYQTPSMVEMLTRSQARLVQPLWPISQPQPR